ncbi:hypothetical protein FB645_001479 [Coemansia sp. IMI 203386]|nr:hypothetical protein FB645_001479 [Coemansia sp. IMI 203386]
MSFDNLDENMPVGELASRLLGSNTGEFGNLNVPEVSQRDLDGLDAGDLQRSFDMFGSNDEVTERGLFSFGGGNGQSKTSHQLIGGAAAWAALNWYQNKSRNEGKKVSHSFIKKLVVAFAAAQAVKYCEKNSSSFQSGVSRDLAIQEATRNAAAMADQSYYQQDNQYQYKSFSNGEAAGYDNFNQGQNFNNNYGGY